MLHIRSKSHIKTPSCIHTIKHFKQMSDGSGQGQGQCPLDQRKLPYNYLEGKGKTKHVVSAKCSVKRDRFLIN